MCACVCARSHGHVNGGNASAKESKVVSSVGPARQVKQNAKSTHHIRQAEGEGVFIGGCNGQLIIIKSFVITFAQGIEKGTLAHLSSCSAIGKGARGGGEEGICLGGAQRYHSDLLSFDMFEPSSAEPRAQRFIHQCDDRGYHLAKGRGLVGGTSISRVA